MYFASWYIATFHLLKLPCYLLGDSAECVKRFCVQTKPPESDFADNLIQNYKIKVSLPDILYWYFDYFKLLKDQNLEHNKLILE